MKLQSPLQLYAEHDFYKPLETIQLQWESRGVEENRIVIYFAKENNVIQGMNYFIQWLNNSAPFDHKAMSRLMSLKKASGENIFREGFLNFLQRFRFKGDIWAIAENTMVFSGQPIIQMQGKSVQLEIVRLWISYLIQPTLDFQWYSSFLQIRRFYNSDSQLIQDVIYSLENQAIANFEAASWEDLLQPVKIANPKS